MKFLRLQLLLAALWVSLAVSAQELRLPQVLSDHAVLQQNASVPVWGWGEPGKTVTVYASWYKQPYTTRVKDDGTWMVTLTTTESKGLKDTHTITVKSGKETVSIQDLLFGEVWICSGQSNMEMPVGGWDHQRVNGALETIRDAASTPGIRMFTVARNRADSPQEDCQGAWKTSTPGAVRHFSATAYHFGKTLTEYLPDVPVGLIATDWGGTPIEAWLSLGALEATPGIDLPLAKSQHWYEVHTAQLFNGMIYPLHRFPARGFIWYQGEANLGNARDYAAITVSMVNEWRALWGKADMPYYLVQIAPYSYGDPDGTQLPLLVEQQYRIPSLLPHSGVAATTDIGHRDCIHPPFKQEVGERLAYLALANDYGVPDLPTTPVYQSLTAQEGALRLHFDGISTSGNCFRIHGPQRQLELKGFELAGASREWHAASAAIDWNTNDIVVSCPEVARPVAARYAFHNWPEGANVVTDNGLPLPMFRTDRWAASDTLRILAIGNSFSEDAVENNLWELLDAAGIPAIVANLYIGGCTLERHYNNSVADAPAYRYRKVVNGETRERLGVRLSEALQEEAWTHVSFQQNSGLSGKYETYDPYLTNLIHYVQGFVPAGTVLAFHQTWAYQQGAPHPDFPNYDRSQEKMFQCIGEAVESALKAHPELTLLIPSGPAIQCARATSLGDNLTRDGYHLDYSFGRYTAACTWFAALTGLRAADNPWKPESVDLATAILCRQAADQAAGAIAR